MEYATDPPIVALAPYDRGTPSGMTDWRLGDLRLSSQNRHGGPDWRIGVEGGFHGGDSLPILKGPHTGRPRGRRLGGLRAALGARAANARADGASAVRRRSQVRYSA